MRLASIIMCSVVMLLLTAESPASAGADDPEWVAVLTGGKLRCKNTNGKFTMVATENGSLSGKFGPSRYKGTWKVVDANTWYRDIYWRSGSSKENQSATLNDDGSISLGPSTCRLKE